MIKWWKIKKIIKGKKKKKFLKL